ncbi:MAG: cupin [Oscillatoriales cyanobacterium RM2_1_1]|nr:cupin [Oscillatoriales cyanobacterium SM2_3_0]NJO45451.1 cupin [Oscillatoriales cyanobacterium RM2_1_1]
MNGKDWCVNDNGECQVRPSMREWDLIRDRYYLHQFLTEIINTLNDVTDLKEEWDRLPQIRMRVRQLITNSYWVQTQYSEPHPQTGQFVTVLYDEIGYPLSIQNVSFAPNFKSSIHNHGTWGVVAVLKGQEKHTFWQRAPHPEFPDQIKPIGERILKVGEIISFTPQAIHQVETIGNEMTVSFHLYGDTQPKSRLKFNPIDRTAKPF